MTMGEVMLLFGCGPLCDSAESPVLSTQAVRRKRQRKPVRRSGRRYRIGGAMVHVTLPNAILPLTLPLSRGERESLYSPLCRSTENTGRKPSRKLLDRIISSKRWNEEWNAGKSRMRTSSLEAAEREKHPPPESWQAISSHRES